MSGLVTLCVGSRKGRRPGGELGEEIKEQEIPNPVGETGLISQDRKQFQKREGSESLPEAPICRQHSAPPPSAVCGVLHLSAGVRGARGPLSYPLLLSKSPRPLQREWQKRPRECSDWLTSSHVPP